MNTRCARRGDVQVGVEGERNSERDLLRGHHGQRTRQLLVDSARGLFRFRELGGSRFKNSHAGLDLLQMICHENGLPAGCHAADLLADGVREGEFKGLSLEIE